MEIQVGARPGRWVLACLACWPCGSPPGSCPGSRTVWQPVRAAPTLPAKGCPAMAPRRPGSHTHRQPDTHMRLPCRSTAAAWPRRWTLPTTCWRRPCRSTPCLARTRRVGKSRESSEQTLGSKFSAAGAATCLLPLACGLVGASGRALPCLLRRRLVGRLRGLGPLQAPGLQANPLLSLPSREPRPPSLFRLASHPCSTQACFIHPSLHCR